MRYMQNRINEYREMELVSLIQSQIVEPLWYHFDVAVLSPNESNDSIDKRYLSIPSINEFMTDSNLNIAIYENDDIELIMGYETRKFDNRLKNVIVLEKNAEVILWSFMSEPNYDGIDIEVSTSNSRIYDSMSKYYDYDKRSLMETLNDSANFYMEIKNTCIEAIDAVNYLCDVSDKDLNFIINKSKCKFKK